MSEELFISVTFTMRSEAEFEQLEEVIELLDVEDLGEANQILSNIKLKQAQEMINTTTLEGSEYNNHFDLIDMYIQTYYQCVDDFEWKFNEQLTGNISVSGTDIAGDDFAAALVLILFSAGASNIHATASSALWQASWQSDNNHCITHQLQREE